MIIKLQAKNCTCITLHVKADNISAIKFYQKNGFKVIKELPQFYLIDGKWHDALFMCKNLVALKPSFWQSFIQLLGISRTSNTQPSHNV